MVGLLKDIFPGIAEELLGVYLEILVFGIIF